MKEEEKDAPHDLVALLESMLLLKPESFISLSTVLSKSCPIVTDEEGI